MNKVEIYDSGRGKYLYRKYWPEKWDELTRAQFVRIAPILFSESDKYKASAQVIYKLLRRPIMALRLQFGELFYLADYIRFVFDEKPASVTFFLKRTWLGLMPVKGPSDNFSDMTAGQFVAAETFFQLAAQTPGDVKALSAFAACLFRPVWRKKFDDSRLQRYASRLSRKNLAFLQAVFLNYMLVRTAVALQYPNVFEPATEKKEQKKRKKDFGWLGVILKLPGDVFGTLEQRSGEPIHNVLMHLELVSIEAQELTKKKSGK